MSNEGFDLVHFVDFLELIIRFLYSLFACEKA
jgi:hypothetical protein